MIYKIIVFSVSEIPATIQRSKKRSKEVGKNFSTLRYVIPHLLSSINHWSVARNILKSGGKKGSIPNLWDGKAANRIVKIISSWSAKG